MAEKLFCETDGVSDLFPFKEYYNDKLKALNKNDINTGYRPDPPLYSVIVEVRYII